MCHNYVLCCSFLHIWMCQKSDCHLEVVVQAGVEADVLGGGKLPVLPFTFNSFQTDTLTLYEVRLFAIVKLICLSQIFSQVEFFTKMGLTSDGRNVIYL